MSIIIPRIDRPQPPYRQIADHYRRLIEQGDLRPGDRIPSVLAMAAVMGVSPGTAHKAARALQADGLVETTRRGSVVAEAVAA
ncbi:GntR family transcriptional regulator [Nocardiopsis alba]|uniref:GntR family transcriptional regulator n=1 Tax=Nocardiopsis alba TaxID=53437 RepID=UPI0036708E2A